MKIDRPYYFREVQRIIANGIKNQILQLFDGSKKILTQRSHVELELRRRGVSRQEQGDYKSKSASRGHSKCSANCWRQSVPDPWYSDPTIDAR